MIAHAMRLGTAVVAALSLASCGHRLGVQGVWHTDSEMVPLGLNVMRFSGSVAVHEIVIFGEHGDPGGMLYCIVTLRRSDDGSWDHRGLGLSGLVLRVEQGRPVVASADGRERAMLEQCPPPACAELSEVDVSTLRECEWPDH